MTLDAQTREELDAKFREDRETLVVAGCLFRPSWFAEHRHQIHPAMIHDFTDV